MTRRTAHVRATCRFDQSRSNIRSNLVFRSNRYRKLRLYFLHRPLSVSLCLSLSLPLILSLSLSLSVCLSLSLSVSVFAFVFVCVWVCVCACLYIICSIRFLVRASSSACCMLIEERKEDVSWIDLRNLTATSIAEIVTNNFHQLSSVVRHSLAVVSFLRHPMPFNHGSQQHQRSSAPPRQRRLQDTGS